MSGFQEILVIVFIITAIIFIPRMTARRPAKQASSRPPAPYFVFKLSGKIRAVIAGAVVYIGAAAVYFQPWQKAVLPFVCFGIGPVALLCLIWWVAAGFKK